MMVRIWRGLADPDKADSYARHVSTHVFPKLRGIAGHRGAYLLRRETNGQIEFLAVTLWESMEAIKRFAGTDASVAVVEPEARAVLAAFDDVVRHYEVVHQPDAHDSN
ncbi:MAG: antibiotic biosynthesis monooxygenase [Hyphomicrobiaceae bacterium]